MQVSASVSCKSKDYLLTYLLTYLLLLILCGVKAGDLTEPRRWVCHCVRPSPETRSTMKWRCRKSVELHCPPLSC